MVVNPRDSGFLNLLSNQASPGPQTKSCTGIWKLLESKMRNDDDDESYSIRHSTDVSTARGEVCIAMGSSDRFYSYRYRYR